MRADQAGTSWWVRAAITLGALLVCSLASAQNASIAGAVKDSTGGALPGVTVEASSPALIEKVRVAQTDGAGQFKITDLPVGAYKVTFSLPGFSTAAREGIELTSGFTATANAELRPGSIEETITVSGASPMVDVQSVAARQVMTRDTMDVIPTGKFYSNYGSLVPGMATSGDPDVGGTVTNGKQRLNIHGGSDLDQQSQMQGMSFSAVHINSGAYSFMVIPDGDIEEVSLTIGSLPAEVENGGVLMNLIPKTGGNIFHGSLFSSYTNSSLQSQNVDEELAAEGIPTNVGVKYNVLASGSLGGPIVRDKFWFHSAYQFTRRINWANAYYNLNHDAPGALGFTYAPDFSRQAVEDHIGKGSLSLRGTYQINSKSKVSFGNIYNDWCECHGGSLTSSPETGFFARTPSHLTQVVYTAPITNRLLIDAGASWYKIHFDRGPQPEAHGPSSTDENGVRTRAGSYSPATAGQYSNIFSHNYTYRASVSYVTGTHAFKVGAFFIPQGDDVNNYAVDVPYIMRTIAGRPRDVTYLPMPLHLTDWVHKYAAFVQDQWTTHHMTVNLGLRYDQFGGGYPDGSVAPVLFPKVTEFSGQKLVDWKDLSPRLGVAYDVFGNGRTAFKVGLSRYVQNYSADLPRLVHPGQALAGTLQRTWNDSAVCATCISGDFVPQGDPLNPAANGEIGPSPNASWGSAKPTVRFDEDWSNGYGVRGFNWEMTAGVQHELMPQMSVSVNYFRRWYGNLEAIDNIAVKPSDYDEYCITTPAHPELPGGGNQQLCGFFDLKPSAFGQLDSVQTVSSKYGKVQEHWNGIDMTMNARLANVLLQGGVSTGVTMTDNCEVRDQYKNKVYIPSSLIGRGINTTAAAAAVSADHCHLETPWLTQVKFQGSYTLPWQGIQVSAALQSLPGSKVSSNYTARNAVIKPSLIRDLSAGPTTSVTLQIIPPGSMYLDRLNQLDLRLGKNLKFGGTTIRASLGLFNALNANTLIGVNSAFGTDGASWLEPDNILDGRLVKFEAQLNF